MSKKKSKKDKKPNIPVQTLARPRLEQILTRRQQEGLNSDETVAAIQQLMQEFQDYRHKHKEFNEHRRRKLEAPIEPPDPRPQGAQ